MKERPIIFNGEMVRAILKGRKTQTRRVIPDNWWRCLDPDDDDDRGRAIPMCPYGTVGDRLWVRETWAEVHPLQAEGRYSQRGNAGIPGPPFVGYRVVYRADGEYPPIWFADSYPYRATKPRDDAARRLDPKGVEFGWAASTSMPRWASRITLEVTGIRVERVQDISDADIVAEGAPKNVCWPIGYSSQLVNWYRTLWDTINAKRGGWDENPWVWAISFKAVRG